MATVTRVAPPPPPRRFRRSVRLAALTGLAMTVALLAPACGDSGGASGGTSVASCTAYVEAINACYADAGVAGSDFDADSTCSGVDVAGGAYSDYYDCLAAIYADADCADLAAFGAIDTSTCTL